MPTGYTACIEDGCTFNDFVLKCARVTPTTKAEIAKGPDPYHVDSIKETLKGLLCVYGMTDKELEAKALENYEQRQKDHTELVASERRVRNQYAVMRAQVENWEPPTGKHLELKCFMLNQIEDSVSPPFKWRVKPAQSAAEWQASEMLRLHEDLEYHWQKHKAEIRRYAERAQYIKDLRASLTEE